MIHILILDTDEQPLWGSSDNQEHDLVLRVMFPPNWRYLFDHTLPEGDLRERRPFDPESYAWVAFRPTTSRGTRLFFYNDLGHTVAELKTWPSIYEEGGPSTFSVSLDARPGNASTPLTETDESWKTHHGLWARVRSLEGRAKPLRVRQTDITRVEGLSAHLRLVGPDILGEDED